MFIHSLSQRELNYLIYVTYLSRFDDKIWKAEYGDRLKLHIGILFKIDSLAYTLQEKATNLYSKCKNKP